VVTEGSVSDIELDDHSISFTTSAIGVPHLVKVSYFPNWVAEGADGPWLASPSLMVVVPTENEVVLEFRNQAPEWIGWLLSITGIAALAAFRFFRGGARQERRDVTSKSGAETRDGVLQP
jgi:uncharacterized membrane protein